MQNAVNSIADAQLVFRRLKMNVRRAILERFPNDLVYKFNDARLLVVAGDFLVAGDFQFHRLVLAHFVERLGTDAVIFFQGLLDLRSRRKRKMHRHPRVEAHRVHHRRVERIAHGNLQLAVLQRRGNHGILKRNFCGNFIPRLG